MRTIEGVLLVAATCFAGAVSGDGAEILLEDEVAQKTVAVESMPGRVQKGRSKAAAVVAIDPGEISVDPDVSGSFEVRVDSGTTPVGAYDIDLSWRASVFVIDSVGAGSSAEFGAPIANIDNEAGVLTIADFQFSSLTAPTGSFTIATVNYTAGANGSTEIGVSVQELADTDGRLFSTTTGNGTFSVAGGPTPTPSATETEIPTPTEQATPTHTPLGVPTTVNPALDRDGSGRIGPEDLLLVLGDGEIPTDLFGLVIDWNRPVGNN
jgi:hypothetical protein